MMTHSLYTYVIRSHRCVKSQVTKQYCVLCVLHYNYADIYPVVYLSLTSVNISGRLLLFDDVRTPRKHWLQRRTEILHACNSWAVVWRKEPLNVKIYLADTWRNVSTQYYAKITSRRRFDVIMTLLLRHVSAGYARFCWALFCCDYMTSPCKFSWHVVQHDMLI